MIKKYITTSASQTKKLGEKLAKEIAPAPLGKSAVVLLLHGDLGSGKTTFLQGFAKGLGIKEKILSPTFVILKHFKVSQNTYYKNGRSSTFVVKDFYHLDCYRINKSEEMVELGWEEIVSNPKNIIAVEWPEKIKKILPKTALKLNFKFLNENTREITLSKNGSHW